MPNVIESYLVSLAFETNDHSFRQFQDTLARAEGVVTHHTSGIVKDLLKTQLGILGAFTGVSAGILAMADKAAAADMSFQILGRQMGITTNEARKYKLILDDMGVSAADITGNMELQGRFLEKYLKLSAQDAQRGPDFSKTMEDIRDLHSEFGDLKLAAIGFSDQVEQGIFKALGTDAVKVKGKLLEFEDWLNNQDNSKWLAGQITPVMQQTKEMLLEAGGVVKDFGVLVLNTMGVVTGDKGLMGPEITMKKVGLAVHHVTDEMHDLFMAMSKAERGLLQFALTGVEALEGMMPKIEALIAKFERLPFVKMLQAQAAAAEAALKDAAKAPHASDGKAPASSIPYLLGKPAPYYLQTPATGKTGKAAADKPGVASNISSTALDLLVFGSTWESKAVGDAWTRARQTLDERMDFLRSPAMTWGLKGAAGGAALGGVAGLWSGPGALVTALGGSALGFAAGVEAHKAVGNVVEAFTPGPATGVPEPTGAVEEYLKTAKGGLRSIIAGMNTPASEMPATDLMEALRNAAKASNYVSPALALAVGRVESGLRIDGPDSPKGAMGPMQLMQGTANDLGIDPHNWRQNAEGGIRYLDSLFGKYGEELKALAAYNYGPGAVDNLIKSRGDNWMLGLPKETADYLPRVLGFEKQYEKSGDGTQAPKASPFEKPLAYMQRPIGADIGQASIRTETNHVTIEVNIAQTNADPREIEEAIRHGVREFRDRDNQYSMGQLSPAFG